MLEKNATTNHMEPLTIGRLLLVFAAELWLDSDTIGIKLTIQVVLSAFRWLGYESRKPDHLGMPNSKLQKVNAHPTFASCPSALSFTSGYGADLSLAVCFSKVFAT